MKKSSIDKILNNINEGLPNTWDERRPVKVYLGRIDGKHCLVIISPYMPIVFFPKGTWSQVNKKGGLLDGEVFTGFKGKRLYKKFIKSESGKARMISETATLSLENITDLRSIKNGTTLVIRQDQYSPSKISKISNEPKASVYYRMKKEGKEIVDERTEFSDRAMKSTLIWIAINLAIVFILMWAISKSGKTDSKLSKKMNEIIKDGRKWKVRVIKEDAPNAFTMIRPTIFMTSGLKKIMTAEEVIAVCLHEAGHVQNKDVIKSLSFSTFLQITMAAAISLATTVAGAISLAIVFFLINNLGIREFIKNRLLGRRMEKRADSWAVKYGYGPQLATALNKLKEWVDTIKGKRPCGRMCKIVGKIDKVLDEHPPIEKRIKKIMENPETYKQKGFRETRDYFKKELMEE